jgi:hypothetical protein
MIKPIGIASSKGRIVSQENSGTEGDAVSELLLSRETLLQYEHFLII